MSKDDTVYIVRALPFSSMVQLYSCHLSKAGIVVINWCATHYIRPIVCGLSVLKRVTQAVVSGL